MKQFFFYICLCLSLFLTGRAASGRQEITIGEVPSVPYLQTSLRTNHGLGYTIAQCSARQGDGYLFVSFPGSSLTPLSISLYIEGNTYDSHVDCFLFDGKGTEITLHTQHLVLEKNDYNEGDILKGFLKLHFSALVTEPPTPSRRHARVWTRTYFVEGPFSALVRRVGFNAFAEENIALYDEALALYEFGSPVQAITFWVENGSIRDIQTIDEIPLASSTLTDVHTKKYEEERERFFLQHPQANGTVIKELIWHEYLNGGGRQIVMWFIQHEERWQQIGFWLGER